MDEWVPKLFSDFAQFFFRGSSGDIFFLSIILKVKLNSLSNSITVAISTLLECNVKADKVTKKYKKVAG